MSAFTQNDDGKPKMRYRQLGSSGVRVSELCMGAMTFTLSGKGVWGLPATDEKTSHAILDRFIELGGNFIDTANAYVESEDVIGTWLAKKPAEFRQSIIIATKFCGAIGNCGPNDRGASRKHIMDSVETSLKKLQTKYIDLYQIHMPDKTTTIRETLHALNDLIRQGKVHYIGCSNFNSWQIQKAADIANSEHLNGFITLQQQYSLLCRNLEWDQLDVCQNEGLGILPWSPLAGGWLSGKFNRSNQKPDADSRVEWAEKIGWTETSWSTKDVDQTWNIIDELRAISKELNVSVAAVALRWLVQRPGVTSTIIGAKTLDQLNDNMQCVTFQLSDEQMARLTKASDTPLPYPFNIIAKFGVK
ncbi:unnamed protein product [Didymodactylos carnosus]|uniref:NADP-dependent oxidoreductase domain-containing protein n=1 Tax=Didymodactylos carnosus TaxID=1234261 RepID=A0A813WPS4_9BILA|nr:unnamed protein product [Didymodactylos carnosus]CAF0864435.1 unnamed protein product [Didymodactylos carnosus]CAF3637190.1 unnamed protein product [Didymodactylos carnosus]CAF3651967.1 unnamed protein product [Didymodactylos carnosus]